MEILVKDCLSELPEGFELEATETEIKIFIWKKGTSDSPYYKGYAWVVIEGELECFHDTALNTEDLVKQLLETVEYWRDFE